MTALVAALSRPIAAHSDLAEIALLSMAGLLASAILLHFGADLGSAL